MIDWSKISKADQETCVRICERFEAGSTEPGYKRINLLMDLEAAHIACPMNLLALLSADDATFGHDLGGISRHINRETGELGGCFVPRTAAGQQVSHACRRSGGKSGAQISLRIVTRPPGRPRDSPAPR